MSAVLKYQPTRADEVRRWVELDALSTFVDDLAEYFGMVDGGEATERGKGMLRSVPMGGFVVADGSTRGDLFDLTERLWPDTDIDERESTVDFILAEAESYALAAQMWSLVATDDARAAFVRLASSKAESVEYAAQRIRARLERERAEA